MATPLIQHQEPRISVNDLAHYKVSSETARLGIIKRSKYPSKPPILRYRDVRPVIVSYLADPNRNVQPLVSAEIMFSQRANDPSGSSLRQDDARQSIEVLHAIQSMRNQLGGKPFSAAPQKQGRLTISGVSVSSYIDLYVYDSTRGAEKIGGALLRMTQDNAETEPAKAKRREAGLYVATVVRLHLEQNLKPSLPVVNKLCMSIDVRHGEAFVAPSSNARRISDIGSACSFIAAVWPMV